jgi:DNA-binding MarR family transcriptional regulator
MTNTTADGEGSEMTSDDPLALEQQVCFAVVVAARSVVALYKPVLEPLGLTHPQYLVMLALWQRTPQTASQLSQALALDPGTLSPLLKRLEAAGLVARERDTRDERQLAVRLTERGAALRAEAEKVPVAVAARLGMGRDELAALRDDLTRVIAAAGG